MHQEIEIQVKIEDPAETERKLKKIGRYLGARKQVDKYFVPPYRDFFAKKPTNEYLRIRYEKDKDHLNYSLVHRDKNKQKILTEEYETPIKEPKVVEEIFKKNWSNSQINCNKDPQVF